MSHDSPNDEADGDEGLSPVTNDSLTEFQYDPSSDTELAVVIVQAIAEQAGTETDTYRGSPLHDYIDVGAIETLLFGTPPKRSTGPGTQNVTFRYRDFLVTVRADGVIQLSTANSSSTRRDYSKGH